MNIAIWKTGHEIADKVAEAVYDGLWKANVGARLIQLYYGYKDYPEFDLYIAYGILRGTAEVFRMARAIGKNFICIDRGYWKPGHFDGYYRISLNGTQQTTGLEKLEPDYERWDALGLEILPQKIGGDYVLVCPQTPEVNKFYGDGKTPIAFGGEKVVFRHKGEEIPLQQDLDGCFRVGTFNSSVGWEALRQGIPVISDPTHSFLGAYMKTVDSMSHMDIDSRRRCFAVQAALQLRLDEIRQGAIWPLIQSILSSASTAAKPLHQTLQPQA